MDLGSIIATVIGGTSVVLAAWVPTRHAKAARRAAETAAAQTATTNGKLLGEQVEQMQGDLQEVRGDVRQVKDDVAYHVNVSHRRA